MLFIRLVFYFALLVLFSISWEKMCVTKLKMCPACRDPIVSDGELLSLPMWKPPIRTRVAECQMYRCKKKWKEDGFSQMISSLSDKRGSAGYKNIFALF